MDRHRGQSVGLDIICVSTDEVRRNLEGEDVKSIRDLQSLLSSAREVIEH
jgi:hypothetical protein